MATILGNWVAGEGFDLALEKIRHGVRGLELIEATLNSVELNPAVPHVGIGGLPNALGVMQFDGAVMDGRTGEVGAVAGLTVSPRAVSVAHAILKFGIHSMLVGEGADRFALESGITDSELSTPSVLKSYLDWKSASFPDRSSPEDANLREQFSRLLGVAPREEKDTAIMITLDESGNFCVGTSTSGWGFKYPGRVGDSPICGAGFFAKNGVGAAACTHTGENSMRTSAAATVVRSMQFGKNLNEALQITAQELLSLKGATLGPLVLHAMDVKGQTAALGVRFDEKTPIVNYCLWQTGMERFESIPVPLYSG